MSDKSKQSILVADDNPKTHGILTATMHKEFSGLRIHSAFDSKAAIDIMQDSGNQVIGVLTDTELEGQKAGTRVISTAHRLNPKPTTCAMSPSVDCETARDAGADFMAVKKIPGINLGGFISAVRERIETK